MKRFLISIFIVSLCTPMTAFSQSDDEGLLEVLRGLLELKVEAALQKQLRIQEAIPVAVSSGTLTCPNLPNSLSLTSKNSEVIILQEFLRDLGPGIYPEGRITGYYGPLTTAAVQRFQQNRGIFFEGQQGYGVTGPVTRETIRNYCATKNNTLVITDPNITPEKTTLVSSEPASDPSSFSSLLNQNNQNLINTNNQNLDSSLFNQDSSSTFLNHLTVNEALNQANLDETGAVQTSPTFKTISFTNSAIAGTMTVGESYLIPWTSSSFSGFDLIFIEGFKQEIHHFFGTTIPTFGQYEITIPEDFSDKESFTLIIKHNNVIKDSLTINLEKAADL